MQLFQINYLQMTDVNCFTLQPNGRFETGKKICLSMSAHHPETWQPSWSSKFVLGIELSAHCFLLLAIYLFLHVLFFQFELSYWPSLVLCRQKVVEQLVLWITQARSGKHWLESESGIVH